DVWALSLSGTPTWTLLAPRGPGPAPRTNDAAAYDSLGGRLIVFGGSTGHGVTLRDAWALSLRDSLAWTELHPEGSPAPPLYDCASTFDPTRRRMLVFGG